MYATSMAQGSS